MKYYYNQQTAEFRSYVVGEIARACVVFNVDEVVVFAEKEPAREEIMHLNEPFTRVEEKANKDSDYSFAAFGARLLQYLETPQ